MNLEIFRDFCLSLPRVEETLPFGPEVLVFKIMGKIFALANIDDFQSVNLKCEPSIALELRDTYQAVLPGYHMNKKHWNTILINSDVNDTNLLAWTKDSYQLVVANLSLKEQKILQQSQESCA
ncbi:MAG TPA: MmcQ-like protein [Microscillaceae bacterium]|nr:MmcQ-like protein [Microscillaceae bacterium]